MDTTLFWEVLLSEKMMAVLFSEFPMQTFVRDPPLDDDDDDGETKADFRNKLNYQSVI